MNLVFLFSGLMSQQIGNESGESFWISFDPYCQILIKTGLFEYKVCYYKQSSQYTHRPESN